LYYFLSFKQVPVGTFGRTVVGISIIGGVIWSSLIGGYVSGVIAPTPFQRSVLEWVKTRHLRERKRDIAARIIQCAWREVLRRRADIAQRKARAQVRAMLFKMLFTTFSLCELNLSNNHAFCVAHVRASPPPPASARR
jgi:hypothetical protein